MTVAADTQKAAAAIANAPQDAAVAVIQTVQNALDGLKDVVVSGVTGGEATADDILQQVKQALPGLDGPFLEFLHLAVKKQAGPTS